MCADSEHPTIKMKYIQFVMIVCYCLQWIRVSNSARILGVFNFDMLSHFRFHEIMMKPLASAGHHVTIFSPFDLQHPHENITAINTKSKSLKNRESNIKSFAKADLFFLQIMAQFLEIYARDCRHVISLLQEEVVRKLIIYDVDVQLSGNIIRNLKHFDVMFVEMMPMNKCFIALAEKMQIPVVGTLSFRSHINVDIAVGHTRNPSVVPTELFYVNLKMSFYDRLINLMNEVFQIRIGRFLELRQLEKFDKLFPGENMQNLDVSLVFINNHASLQNSALAPNVVSIGGIAVKSAKLTSLPEHFEKFINEAKHGVILFSLGTLASSDAADPHLTSILKNTFSKIPQRVIWKYNGTMAVSDNVLLSAWIPQKEILAHKNVVAFISHCGISSSYEAIYFSKPMILLPIFADQPGNAALLEHLGVGLYLNVVQLTEEKLLEAINEVTSNQIYLSNMEKLSRRFRDDPKSPEELVIYWTEYVLRHKTATLRSATVDIVWYQYLLLDVFTFLVIVSVFTIASMYMLRKYLIFLVFRFLKKDTLNNKNS